MKMYMRRGGVGGRKMKEKLTPNYRNSDFFPSFSFSSARKMPARKSIKASAKEWK
jgi:hypothetical protein